MKSGKRAPLVCLLGVLVPGPANPSWAARFEIAPIYIESNSSANDLGFHVSLEAGGNQTFTEGSFDTN